MGATWDVMSLLLGNGLSWLHCSSITTRTVGDNNYGCHYYAQLLQVDLILQETLRELHNDHGISYAEVEAAGLLPLKGSLGKSLSSR